jgi:outer membrane protein OmpA-like peptidoglycan-associated protein
MISSSHGQIKQGDEYYAAGEFFRAIPFYKKDTRSRDTARKKEALVKLANCYRFINEYIKSEDAYRKAVDLGVQLAPEDYYNYAQILKANTKYEDAAVQYENYIKLAPNDLNAKNALKFCLEIKYYLSKPIEYEVKNMETINTEKSEFSPFVINNKLMFIAEREAFDFVNYNVNDYNGQPYMNMFISKIDGTEPQKSKNFSRKVNTEYHEGPACISADGQTLYFTRVDHILRKGNVNYSKIYTAVGSGRDWKKIKPLELGKDDYSVGHPSISGDNNLLFFTSNMPGGYGGKDIYMCQRNGDTWGEPVNLGPDINTTGDEMFPSINKNGMLFFSSNGLPGFGGLDIYSAKKVNDKWILNRNEGLNLNSSRDDFGITFLNDTMGYFSSNRAGGKGNDDIYLYDFNNRSMVVTGNVLLTENLRDYAKNKKVLLLDEKGNVVDSMYTNEKGFFKFQNLDSDRKYMAVIVEDDPQLTGKARYYLAENDSVIHRVTGKYKDNKYAFRNLPIDPNGLPDLYTEDDLVFAGTIKYGEGEQPLINAKLKLVNDFGDVLEEATTNEYGAFAFRNIPSDQNYIVAIEEGDVRLPEGTKILLANKAGKDVRTFYKGKGKFTFEVLNADKTLLEDMDAEDVNMVMGIYGYLYDQEKRPLVNTKIKVMDEDGSNAQEWTTAANGRFNFKNMDAEKNYIFETDENDPTLTGVTRIYIADSKGRIYKVVDLMGGKFMFKILEVDKFTMGEFVIDDPWMKMTEVQKEEKLKKLKKVKEVKEVKEKEHKEVAVKEPKVKEEPKHEEEEVESEMTVTIVENIYYPYGVWEIGPDGKAVLDKAVDALNDYPKLIMEISSHTDSQSSSEFNMGLSWKRAQTAVDYLVSKGISRTRLKAKGYGETKLLNKCADGVECTEEEHKVNRRTEFKITKPIKR